MEERTKRALFGIAGIVVARGVVRRLRRKKWKGASVVISGGSRGLGLEIAREFSRHGARIVLLARDAEELERARRDLWRFGGDVLAIQCDVRDADEVRRAVRRIIDTLGGVDAVVNAAGVIQVAPFEHITSEDFEESFAVHVWGPLHVIREVLPHMRRGGRIVNISSIGGLVAVPHLLPYSTGKFALKGLSDGLRAELSRRGIYVTTVCPGLMRTGSHVNAQFKGRHQEEFMWFSLGAALPLFSTSSTRAARKIVAACRDAKPHLIITPQARMLHLLDALAPNTTSHLMGLVARMLPSASDEGGDRELPGWQSRSSAAPSMLTKLADRAIHRNNELSAAEESAYFSSDGNPAQ